MKPIVLLPLVPAPASVTAEENAAVKIDAGSPCGRWLRDNVEFMVLPFADKDGAEDGGQGKNREPHDHNRDYHGKPIYPAVAALKKRVPKWVAGKPCYGFDLHCP